MPGVCGNCGTFQPFSPDQMEIVLERLRVTPNVVAEEEDPYEPAQDLTDAVAAFQWLESEVGSAASEVFAAVYAARRSSDV
jgi:hypothetical protein